MILPKSLAKYTAQELIDSGEVHIRQSHLPIILKRLQENRLDKKIQENLKIQELIGNANKALTGDPWMRNQHKLGVLFSEFDKLIALMDGLSALEPSNPADQRGRDTLNEKGI